MSPEKSGIWASVRSNLAFVTPLVPLTTSTTTVLDFPRIQSSDCVHFEPIAAWAKIRRCMRSRNHDLFQTVSTHCVPEKLINCGLAMLLSGQRNFFLRNSTRVFHRHQNFDNLPVEISFLRICPAHPISYRQFRNIEFRLLLILKYNSSTHSKQICRFASWIVLNHQRFGGQKLVRRVELWRWALWNLTAVSKIPSVSKRSF